MKNPGGGATTVAECSRPRVTGGESLAFDVLPRTAPERRVREEVALVVMDPEFEAEEAPPDAAVDPCPATTTPVDDAVLPPRLTALPPAGILRLMAGCC